MTIPLDPGSGGRSVDEQALAIGDIVVSTTPALISRAIRGATGSVVSHAMLYIGGGQVVEAIQPGVTLRSLRAAVADASLAAAYRHPRITESQATPPSWVTPDSIPTLRIRGTLTYVGHLKA